PGAPRPARADAPGRAEDARSRRSGTAIAWRPRAGRGIGPDRALLSLSLRSRNNAKRPPTVPPTLQRRPGRAGARERNSRLADRGHRRAHPPAARADPRRRTDVPLRHRFARAREHRLRAAVLDRVRSRRSDPGQSRDHRRGRRASRAPGGRRRAMSHKEPDLPLALGSVREALAKRGTKELDQVAAAVEAALARLSAIHPWAFHLYLQRGADATAQVVAESGAERDCILWTHNMYLGLNREPQVIEKTVRALEAYGTGAGASPPVGGFTGLHDALARRLA